MILSILMAVLSLTIGIISLATATHGKEKKKLTAWGKGVIVLSVVLCGISIWKLVEDSTREKDTPFLMSEADIQPQLYASLTNVPASAELDAETPKAIQLTIVIPQGGGWACILESIGFVAAGYSRGSPTVRKAYLSRGCKQFDNLKVKYAWDLNGKTIQVRNPKSYFSSISPKGIERTWRTELTLRIKQMDFLPIDRDQSPATLYFKLEGLDRQTLMVRSSGT